MVPQDATWHHSLTLERLIPRSFICFSASNDVCADTLGYRHLPNILAQLRKRAAARDGGEMAKEGVGGASDIKIDWVRPAARRDLTPASRPIMQESLLKSVEQA